MPTLIGEKRQGSITIRPGKNGVLVQEQPFYVTVMADYKFQDRVAIILNTPGMPRFGQIYAGGLAVKSINAERDEDDPLRWHVTITASSEVEEDQETRNESSGSPSSNPIEWIPIANVRFEAYDEVLKKDINGKKWVNSAKKPFETGLVRQRRIAMVAFSQFEPASTKLETIMDRCDTINSTEYKGKDEKTLLLNVEGATIGTYSGIRCWRVDYTMRYKEDTWTLFQLDVGYGYYQSGEFKPFVDAEGNQYLGSLNGSGGKVANEETDEPEELEFELYKAINFNTFLKVLFT